MTLKDEILNLLRSQGPMNLQQIIENFGGNVRAVVIKTEVLDLINSEYAVFDDFWQVKAVPYDEYMAAKREAENREIDENAVNKFAWFMKAKLAKAREKGRSGWHDKDQCTQQDLSRMLREHLEKGDPVDVANFCMFLHMRGEGIL
jgi:hypothetical protein